MKGWFGLILCLLLSGSFWLAHMLSKDYSDYVSIPVMASSNIEGRAERSSSEVIISARCEASGFSLLTISQRRRAVPVFIDANDFTHDNSDYYSVSSAALEKYIPDIFGPSVTVSSFAAKDFQFRFAAENYRKVPVAVSPVLNFRPQYMPVQEFKVSPDSVFIYGEPKMLRNINVVRTSQIVLNDVSANLHGAVGLIPPKGVRVSVPKVEYSLEVTRFVEITTTVPIVTRNAPDSTHFLVLPSSASVVYKCMFPVEESPLDKVEFYVDYLDFIKSISGKCLVRCDGLPGSVIDFTVNPQVCDCIEQ